MNLDDYSADDEVCWQCDLQPAVAVRPKRTPGWCARCGFFFDLYGMRILDPTVKCKMHSPIKASCPHSCQNRQDGGQKRPAVRASH